MAIPVNFGAANEQYPTALAFHGGTLYMVGQGDTSTSGASRSKKAALYTVDTTTGTAQRVGSSDDFGVGEELPVGLVSNNGKLYMVGETKKRLYILDTTTGAATQYRPENSPTSFGIGEIEPEGLVEHNGTLYFVGNHTNYLCTFDRLRGIATQVGIATNYGLTAAPNFGDLASDGTNLYAVSGVSSVEGLYTIDVTDGTASKISFNNDGFGVDRRSPVGLASDGINLWLSTSNNPGQASDPSRLYKLDTDTGKATRVGNVDNFGSNIAGPLGLAYLGLRTLRIELSANATLATGNISLSGHPTGVTVTSVSVVGTAPGNTWELTFSRALTTAERRAMRIRITGLSSNPTVNTIFSNGRLYMCTGTNFYEVRLPSADGDQSSFGSEAVGTAKRIGSATGVDKLAVKGEVLYGSAHSGSIYIIDISNGNPNVVRNTNHGLGRIEAIANHADANTLYVINDNLNSPRGHHLYTVNTTQSFGVRIRLNSADSGLVDSDLTPGGLTNVTVTGVTAINGSSTTIWELTLGGSTTVDASNIGSLTISRSTSSSKTFTIAETYNRQRATLIGAVNDNSMTGLVNSNLDNTPDSTHPLYGVSQSNSGSLYTLNPTTGAATRVTGTVTNFGLSTPETDPTCLEWGGTSGNETLYMTGTATDKMYTMDKDTGKATDLGSITGITSGQDVESLAWDTTIDKFYLSTSGPTGGQFLYTLDSSPYTTAAVVSGCPANFGLSSVETKPRGIATSIYTESGTDYPRLYMVGKDTENFYQIQLNGAAFPVELRSNFGRTTSFNPRALAGPPSSIRPSIFFDTADYLLTVDSTNLNPSNGFGTFEGGGSYNLQLDPRGATYNNSDNLYYLTNDQDNALYTLNSATNVITRVGSAVDFGPTADEDKPRGLAVSGGNMYMVGQEIPRLYRINSGTGVATPVDDSIIWSNVHYNRGTSKFEGTLTFTGIGVSGIANTDFNVIDSAGADTGWTIDSPPATASDGDSITVSATPGTGANGQFRFRLLANQLDDSTTSGTTYPASDLDSDPGGVNIDSSITPATAAWSNVSGGTVRFAGTLTFTGANITGLTANDFEVLDSDNSDRVLQTRWNFDILDPNRVATSSATAGSGVIIEAWPGGTSTNKNIKVRLKAYSVRSASSLADNSPTSAVTSESVGIDTRGSGSLTIATPVWGNERNISGTLQATLTFNNAPVTGIEPGDFNILDSNDALQTISSSGWSIAVSPDHVSSGGNVTVTATPPANTNGTFRLQLKALSVSSSGTVLKNTPATAVTSGTGVAIDNSAVTASWDNVVYNTTSGKLEGELTFTGAGIAGIEVGDFKILDTTSTLTELSTWTFETSSATATSGNAITIKAEPPGSTGGTFKFRLSQNSVRSGGSSTDNFPGGNIDSSPAVAVDNRQNLVQATASWSGESYTNSKLQGTLTFSVSSGTTTINGVEDSDFEVIDDATPGVVQSNWNFDSITSPQTAGTGFTVAATPPASTNGTFKLRLKADSVQSGGSYIDNAPDSISATAGIAVDNRPATVATAAWSSPSYNTANGRLQGTITFSGANVTGLATTDFAVLNASDVEQTGWSIELPSGVTSANAGDAILIKAAPPTGTNASFKLRLKATSVRSGGSSTDNAPTANVDFTSDIAVDNRSPVVATAAWSSTSYTGGKLQGTMTFTGADVTGLDTSDFAVLTDSGGSATGWTIELPSGITTATASTGIIIKATPPANTNASYKIRLAATSVQSGGSTTNNAPVANVDFTTGVAVNNSVIATWSNISYNLTTHKLSGTLTFRGSNITGITNSDFKVLSGGADQAWTFDATPSTATDRTGITISVSVPSNAGGDVNLSLKANSVRSGGSSSDNFPSSDVTSTAIGVDNRGKLVATAAWSSESYTNNKLQATLTFYIGSGGNPAINDVETTDFEVIDNTAPIPNVQSRWVFDAITSSQTAGTGFTVAATPPGGTNGTFKLRLKARSVRSDNSYALNSPASDLDTSGVAVSRAATPTVATASWGTLTGGTTLTGTVTFSATPIAGIGVTDFEVLTDAGVATTTGWGITSVSPSSLTNGGDVTVTATPPSQTGGNFKLRLKQTSVQSDGSTSDNAPSGNVDSQSSAGVDNRSGSQLPAVATVSWGSMVGGADIGGNLTFSGADVVGIETTDFEVVDNAGTPSVQSGWSLTVSTNSLSTGNAVTVTATPPSTVTTGTFRIRIKPLHVRSGGSFINNAPVTAASLTSGTAALSLPATAAWSTPTYDTSTQKMSADLTFTFSGGGNITGITASDFEVRNSQNNIETWTFDTPSATATSGTAIPISVAVPVGTNDRPLIRLKATSLRSPGSATDNSPVSNTDTARLAIDSRTNIVLATPAWGTPINPGNPPNANQIQAELTFTGANVAEIETTDFEMIDHSGTALTGTGHTISLIGGPAVSDGGSVTVTGTPNSTTFYGNLGIRLKNKSIKSSGSVTNNIPSGHYDSAQIPVDTRSGLTVATSTWTVPSTPQQAMYALTLTITFSAAITAGTFQSEDLEVLDSSGNIQSGWIMGAPSPNAARTIWTVTATPPSTAPVGLYRLRLMAYSVMSGGSVVNNAPAAAQTSIGQRIDPHDIATAAWSNISGGTELSGTLTFSNAGSGVRNIEDSDFRVLNDNDRDVTITATERWSFYGSADHITGNSGSITVTARLTPSSNVVGKRKLRLIALNVGSDGGTDNAPLANVDSIGANINHHNGFGVGEELPTGLTTHKNHLYMVGQTNKALYRVGTQSGIATQVGPNVEEFGVGEALPVGLADVNGKLYMVGNTTEHLYELDANTGIAKPTAPIQRSGFGVSEGSPSGMVYDSNTSATYLVGTDTNRLYSLDLSLSRGTRLGLVDDFGMDIESTEKFEVLDLASDGQDLYGTGRIIDSGGNSVEEGLFRLNPTDGTARYLVESFGRLETDPVSFTMASDGTTAWMLGAARKALYTINLSDYTVTEISNVENFGVGETQPTGIAYIGNSATGTLYMVGNINKTLYAVKTRINQTSNRFNKGSRTNEFSIGQAVTVNATIPTNFGLSNITNTGDLTNNSSQLWMVKDGTNIVELDPSTGNFVTGKDTTVSGQSDITGIATTTSSGTGTNGYILTSPSGSNGNLQTIDFANPATATSITSTPPDIGIENVKGLFNSDPANAPDNTSTFIYTGSTDKNGSLYTVNSTNKSTIRRIPSENFGLSTRETNPTGLTWDSTNNRMLMTGTATSKFYIINRDNGEAIEESDTAVSGITPRPNLTGLDYINNTVYALDDSVNTVDNIDSGVYSIAFTPSGGNPIHSAAASRVAATPSAEFGVNEGGATALMHVSVPLSGGGVDTTVYLVGTEQDRLFELDLTTGNASEYGIPSGYGQLIRNSTALVKVFEWNLTHAEERLYIFYKTYGTTDGVFRSRLLTTTGLVGTTRDSFTTPSRFNPKGVTATGTVISSSDSQTIYVTDDGPSGRIEFTVNNNLSTLPKGTGANELDLGGITGLIISDAIKVSGSSGTSVWEIYITKESSDPVSAGDLSGITIDVSGLTVSPRGNQVLYAQPGRTDIDDTLYTLDYTNPANPIGEQINPPSQGRLSPGFGVGEYAPRGLTSLNNQFYMIGQTNKKLYRLNHQTGIATAVAHPVAPPVPSTSPNIHPSGGTPDPSFRRESPQQFTTQSGGNSRLLFGQQTNYYTRVPKVNIDTIEDQVSTLNPYYKYIPIVTSITLADQTETISIEFLKGSSSANKYQQGPFRYGGGFSIGASTEGTQIFFQGITNDKEPIAATYNTANSSHENTAETERLGWIPMDTLATQDPTDPIYLTREFGQELSTDPQNRPQTDKDQHPERLVIELGAGYTGGGKLQVVGWDYHGQRIREQITIPEGTGLNQALTEVRTKSYFTFSPNYTTSNVNTHTKVYILEKLERSPHRHPDGHDGEIRLVSYNEEVNVTFDLQDADFLGGWTVEAQKGSGVVHVYIGVYPISMSVSLARTSALTYDFECLAFDMYPYENAAGTDTTEGDATVGGVSLNEHKSTKTSLLYYQGSSDTDTYAPDDAGTLYAGDLRFGHPSFTNSPQELYTGWQCQLKLARPGRPDDLAVVIPLLDTTFTVNQTIEQAEMIIGERNPGPLFRSGLREVTLSGTMLLTRDRNWIQEFRDNAVFDDGELILTNIVTGGFPYKTVFTFGHGQLTTAPDATVDGLGLVSVPFNMMFFDEDFGDPTDFKIVATYHQDDWFRGDQSTGGLLTY